MDGRCMSTVPSAFRALLSWVCIVGPVVAFAQTDTTVFPHPEDVPYLAQGQLNVITQAHPSFPARYTGEYSLKPGAEVATSLVATLYTALQLSPTTEVMVAVELAGGGGIGTALGLAGFTNLDVVRNPTLGSEPYLGRVLLRQVIPLSETWVEVARTPLSVATRLPTRRFEVTLGKLSTADFFDINAVGSDSHLQFMNWTVDNNGAYDYAADTRGYTYGLVVEYQDVDWAARFGEMLMPQVANGLILDWDVSRSRAENVEVELRHHLLPGRNGAVRFLAFFNHANMGLYREAINAFQAGEGVTPEIEAHREKGRLKVGFGLNLEQEWGGPVRSFVRLGWSDGTRESFAYTEVDDTLAVGVDARGEAWGRARDKVGLAYVTNGLSVDHREYLALGGHGFLLGDGGLTYGREQVFEGYYTAHVWRGVFATADLQLVTNPGYNRDRGPLAVGSLRLHVDF